MLSLSKNMSMWCCKELFDDDVITTLIRDIQDTSVAEDVSPYSSYCTTASHFCSAYTLLVEFIVKCPDGRV